MWKGEKKGKTYTVINLSILIAREVRILDSIKYSNVSSCILFRMYLIALPLISSHCLLVQDYWYWYYVRCHLDVVQNQMIHICYGDNSLYVPWILISSVWCKLHCHHTRFRKFLILCWNAFFHLTVPQNFFNMFREN